MKAKNNRNFLHKLYISGDGEDWDSFEELEAELTRIEELAAKGLRLEQQHPPCGTCGHDKETGDTECKIKHYVSYCSNHTELDRLKREVQE